MTFEPGDSVQLKSGGDTMSVERTEGDLVYCVWRFKTTKGWQSGRDRFHSAVLVKAGPGIVGISSRRV